MSHDYRCQGHSVLVFPLMKQGKWCWCWTFTYHPQWREVVCNEHEEGYISICFYNRFNSNSQNTAINNMLVPLGSSSLPLAPKGRTGTETKHHINKSVSDTHNSTKIYTYSIRKNLEETHMLVHCDRTRKHNNGRMLHSASYRGKKICILFQCNNFIYSTT